MKLTANLIVPSIETCLPFWVGRLGLVQTVEVPHGDGLGFVILQNGDLSLMLQSRDSLAADVPEAAVGAYRNMLYVHVDDLDAIRVALTGWPHLAPARTTFYGAREIIVADPAGNTVFFAQNG